MRFSAVLASVSMLATSLLVATPTLATVETTLETQFPEAVRNHLVKHHAHLYSINENQDETISIYTMFRPADGWTEMDSDHPQISELVADTEQVDGFALFKEDIYMAARNTEGMSQVWSMCKHCRPAEWETSGEAGFGDEANTQIVDLISARGSLYALTENVNGNQLYETSNGRTWTQVGENGLGFSLTDAVGVTRNKIDEVDYFYLGTSSGAIYRATVEDPSIWSLVTTLEGEVTGVYQSHVALIVDDVAFVYNAEDGVNYIQVGEDGLGNTNNSQVTRFSRLADHWFAVTQNATDGAEIRRWNSTDETWDLVTEAGFGDANNSEITDLIRFRNHRYASTVNETDGPTIYKLEGTNP